MNDVIVFMLKVILLLLVCLGVYYAWRLKASKSWEDLVVHKQQQSGSVLLRRTNYSVNYARIAILVIAMIFMFRTPLYVADVLNGTIVKDAFSSVDYNRTVENVVNKVNDNQGEVYLVKANYRLASDEYKLMEANSLTDLADYYTYQVDVLEEYAAHDAVMFSDINSKVVLSDAVTLSYEQGQFMQLDSFSASSLPENSVYLVLGNYINHETGYLFEDERLHKEHYIYSYEAIFLPGYDLSKPFKEQNQSIQDIVEEYTRGLD